MARAFGPRRHRALRLLPPITKGRRRVSRLLRMALLAPEIVESVLDGRQPEGLTLPALMQPFLVKWEYQRTHLLADVPLVGTEPP